MKLKERIIKLIKEPSTWAGIASVLGGAAIFGLGTEEWTQAIGGLMILIGAVASGKLDPADKDDTI